MAEGPIFGCDHAEVGGLLLKRWKLPVSLEVAVRYHHEPQRYRDPLEPSIVHLADVISNAVEKGSSGERFIPPLSEVAWECVGLSARILPTVLEQMEAQREAVVQGLFRDNGV
jgi:HD-like signal output (HDOD) protein